MHPVFSVSNMQMRTLHNPQPEFMNCDLFRGIQGEQYAFEHLEGGGFVFKFASVNTNNLTWNLIKLQSTSPSRRIASTITQSRTLFPGFWSDETKELQFGFWTLWTRRKSIREEQVSFWSVKSLVKWTDQLNVCWSSNQSCNWNI